MLSLEEKLRKTLEDGQTSNAHISIEIGKMTIPPKAIHKFHTSQQKSP